MERQSGILNKRRKEQMKQSSTLMSWYEIKIKSGSGHFETKETLSSMEKRKKKDG